MPATALHPFGFDCEFNHTGNVLSSWTKGDRLVIMFSERHSDRAGIRENVLSACQLFDRGTVSFVGDETPLDYLETWEPERIEGASSELFAKHGNDDGVLTELQKKPPLWFGGFRFGKALRLLRPTLRV